MREDQVFVWTTKKNVIYVVLACSKNYDRHLWFWLQWKAWERKKSVQSGWGTVKNKDRGGSGGVNILFAFPHPFPPWATLTPNQTWPFEEMITSISMLTPLNEMPALQAKIIQINFSPCKRIIVKLFWCSHHVLHLSNLQCLPCGDPKSLCKNKNYRQLIH